MSTFVVKKRISLEFLGDGWDKAFLNFSPFSFSDNAELTKFRREVTALQNDPKASDEDLEKFTDKMLSIILDKFIDGQGFDGKQLIPVTKENFSDLPMEVFMVIIEKLQGDQLTKKN